MDMAWVPVPPFHPGIPRVPQPVLGGGIQLWQPHGTGWPTLGLTSKLMGHHHHHLGCFLPNWDSEPRLSTPPLPPSSQSLWGERDQRFWQALPGVLCFL